MGCDASYSDLFWLGLSSVGWLNPRPGGDWGNFNGIRFDATRRGQAEYTEEVG